MSDYLFDGEGPPDPEIEALEDQLRTLRYQPPERARRRAILAGGALAAVAAAAVLTAVGLGWAWSRPTALTSDDGSWTAVSEVCDGCAWTPGTHLATAGLARATLADRGTVIAQPGAVVSRLPSDTGARLALERGQIDIEVDAPAGWLVVDIPGGQVVDLGCAYTLTVDEARNSTVVVRSGAVALEGTTRTEVLEGSAAAAWSDGRTGLPVRVDADPQLARAVDSWDTGRLADPMPILDLAGDRDMVTLWHLLERQPVPERRVAVVARMDELMPGGLPVDREALIEGDESALDVLFARIVGMW